MTMSLPRLQGGLTALPFAPPLTRLADLRQETFPLRVRSPGLICLFPNCSFWAFAIVLLEGEHRGVIDRSTEALGLWMLGVCAICWAQKWGVRCAIPLHLCSAVQGDKHHGGLMPCPGNFSIPQFRLHLAHNHWVFNGVRLFPTGIWLLSEIAAQIWQGLFQLSTKLNVLPTKGQDVQDFLEELYFFMPLKIAKCTVLLLQHKPHYSSLWILLFLKEYWELLTLCAVWPGRRIRSLRCWSTSGCQQRVLVQVWQSSGISLPGPGVSTNVAFLVKHWAGRQGEFCLAWCWSYGGVCKHENNSVVNLEVIWRDMLLHLLIIRCVWAADTSFLKANRHQKREIPTIQGAILWQMGFGVYLRSKRNCDNQLSPKCLHFLWSNPSHKLPVPPSKSYWKQWKDSHWFNPSYGHALGEERFVILLIATSTIKIMYTVISISNFRLHRLCGKYLWIT